MKHIIVILFAFCSVVYGSGIQRSVDFEYKKSNTSDRCCTSKRRAYRRCHYYKPASFCKNLCSLDLKCKGYAVGNFHICQVATTSPCYQDDLIDVYDGDTEDLDPNATCGEEGSWKGCFIKTVEVEKTCDFKTGYAKGGTDKQIGFTQSVDKCVQLVKRYEPRANAITWESQDKKCYAEFGATSIGTECTICRACIFGDTLDSNSVYGEDPEEDPYDPDKCKQSFQKHPYANCILYTDQNCGSNKGFEPEPINRAVAYLKYGLTSRYRNEIKAISVRQGCSLRVSRGFGYAADSEEFRGVDGDLHFNFDIESNSDLIRSLDESVNSFYCHCPSTRKYNYRILQRWKPMIGSYAI